MNLTVCPRCGASVSSSARRCEACGCEFGQADGADSVQLGRTQFASDAGPVYLALPSGVQEDPAGTTAATGPASPKGQPLIENKYAIEREIGRGGFGTVFLARDLVLQKRVAVKVLHPTLAANPRLAEAMLREARTIAHLDHPGIVRVVTAGKDPLRGPYLVMDFIAGTSLRERLRREGRLSAPEAIRIMRGILGAVAHAHQQGVMHRDLKPENVILTPSGGVKVLDFGLAKVFSDSSSATAEQGQTVSTLHGAGTRPYMSPEQSLGLRIDHRTDIYAAGVMLYELLVGSWASSESVSDFLEGVVAGKPPDIAPPGSDVSPSIREVYERAVAKDKERRFASAREMMETLWADGKPVPAPRGAPARHPTPLPKPRAPEPPPIDDAIPEEWRRARSFLVLLRFPALYEMNRRNRGSRTFSDPVFRRFLARAHVDGGILSQARYADVLLADSFVESLASTGAYMRKEAGIHRVTGLVTVLSCIVMFTSLREFLQVHYPKVSDPLLSIPLTVGVLGALCVVVESGVQLFTAKWGVCVACKRLVRKSWFHFRCRRCGQGLVGF